MTSETKISFKGYYRVSAGEEAVFLRPFVQFDGEGEAANARQRAIGGHPADALAEYVCESIRSSPYANYHGYVPVGKLVDYAGGRSDGCTSWSPSDARQIIPMLRDNPTTVYIYPESRDIDTVARGGRGGSYWNASCLKEIGSPKFWPKESLEPIIARYEKEHPAAAADPANGKEP